MKKKRWLIAMAMVVGISGYFGVKSMVASDSVSMLQLSNVEALVGGEGDKRYKCYSSTHYKDGARVIMCDTCEAEEDQTDDLFCFHDWCYR